MATPPDRSRLEWLAVAAITAVGLGLRLWPLGRLGLTHFDEGIYAMSGGWVFQRGGIAAIDPMLIAFAPPGYSILVGLMYTAFGRSDVAAIGVSQIAATFSIPVVAWLARRTFGAGSGFAAASLASLSGPHIAFSRMALTDASFLLSWLLAIAAGMRFLDRPTAARGLVMGLAVGLAQQFKYNGWLSGAVVILAALGGLARAEERRPRVLLRTFGWGFLGVLVAGLVVLPWYRFVEAHGGYPALLQHQRSYLVGATRWVSSFRTQADQTVALSGSHSLMLAAWLVAGSGGAFFRWFAERSEGTWRLPGPIVFMVPATLGVILLLIPNAAWWLGLAVVPGLITSRSPSTRLVGVWWLGLSTLTPFYHPYARLWLPIHAAGWIIVGGWLGNGASEASRMLRRIRGEAGPSDPGLLRLGLAWAWFLAVGTVWSIELDRPGEAARILPGLLDPSDSLRNATDRVVAIAPDGLEALRTYGRPSVTFYLAGRLPIRTQEAPGPMFRGTLPRQWALYDPALGGPEGWPPGAADWEVVEQIPTELALPTLLDISPGAATGRQSARSARYSPLFLFRARTLGSLLE